MVVLRPPGILQQFAISQATLMAWTSMDGESLRSGSNQGSVAHLSEVNQESITSRGTSSQASGGVQLTQLHWKGCS